jgi:hypothetical protein
MLKNSRDSSSSSSTLGKIKKSCPQLAVAGSVTLGVPRQTKKQTAVYGRPRTRRERARYIPKED